MMALQNKKGHAPPMKVVHGLFLYNRKDFELSSHHFRVLQIRMNFYFIAYYRAARFCECIP